MNKTQRVKIYEWCRANKSNSGAEYPKPIRVSHRGYEMVRDNIKKNMPYARWEILSGIGEEYKQLKIYIQ